MSIPMNPQQVLDRYFLEMRCKVLDVAAAIDRVDRAGGLSSLAGDPRVRQLTEAITALGRDESGRAEAIQRIFSLPYDPAWPRPKIGA